MTIPSFVFSTQPETVECILKLFTIPKLLSYFLVFKCLLPQSDYSTFEVFNVSFSSERSLILIEQFEFLCCSLESQEDLTQLLRLKSRLCICLNLFFSSLELLVHLKALQRSFHYYLVEA